MNKACRFPIKPIGGGPGFVKAKQPVNEHEVGRSSRVCAQNLHG